MWGPTWAAADLRRPTKFSFRWAVSLGLCAISLRTHSRGGLWMSCLLACPAVASRRLAHQRVDSLALRPFANGLSWACGPSSILGVCASKHRPRGRVRRRCPTLGSAYTSQGQARWGHPPLGSACKGSGVPGSGETETSVPGVCQPDRRPFVRMTPSVNTDDVGPPNPCPHTKYLWGRNNAELLYTRGLPKHPWSIVVIMLNIHYKIRRIDIQHIL